MKKAEGWRYRNQHSGWAGRSGRRGFLRLPDTMSRLKMPHNSIPAVR